MQAPAIVPPMTTTQGTSEATETTYTVIYGYSLPVGRKSFADQGEAEHFATLCQRAGHNVTVRRDDSTGRSVVIERS